MKILKFLAYFCLCPTIFAGDLAYYSKNVRLKCSGVESLLVKKSMIEFHQGTEEACQKIFSKTIINRCEQISCQQLTNIYQDSFNRIGGSVIGEEN